MSLKTANKERIEALKLLVNLVKALSEVDSFSISGDLGDAEMDASYFLQEHKLSPYREDHQKNIEELFND